MAQTQQEIPFLPPLVAFYDMNTAILLTAKPQGANYNGK